MALSLVEKGWAGARVLSLDLARKGIPVLHLVKGSIPPATREVLTPDRGVTLRDIPQRLYRAAAWAQLWFGQRTGRTAIVITDNAKTASWVRNSFPRLRERVLLVAETEAGRSQILEKGSEVRLP